MLGHRPFSRFLAHHPGQLHFAAHSHHPWPDVSLDGHHRAWLDAAELADRKWQKVFEEVLPCAQAHVARELNLPDPQSICFAPSTHELVMRLLSALDEVPLRILTTDSEFHSFERQMRRLEEDHAVQVHRVPVTPFETLEARFGAAIEAGGYDLLYFSQCFFNSGFRLTDLDGLVRRVPQAHIPVVIDGYHGYMAVPTDLSALHSRVFYVAGGYKYAMVGEGACFMHCPAGYAERPRNTGWFAGFGELSAEQDRSAVRYAAKGARFMGATYDPTPLYRLNAVMDWLQQAEVGAQKVHAHARDLQERFLVLRAERGLLSDAELLPPARLGRGNFLVFRTPTAGSWHRRLLQHGVLTDYRDDRLRIGFGVYHEIGDVELLATRIEAATT